MNARLVQEAEQIVESLPPLDARNVSLALEDAVHDFVDFSLNGTPEQTHNCMVRIVALCIRYDLDLEFATSATQIFHR